MLRSPCQHGRTSTVVTAAAVLAGLLTVRPAAADWPGFLAGGRLSLPAADVPATWGPESNRRWRTDLPGYGQSSPVVVGDRIYVTTVRGPEKDECLVSAVGLADGAIAWTHAAANPTPVKNSVYVSRAAPTPVADADGVVAFFEGGLVVALSPTGKVAWTRDLVESFGPIGSEFGLAASPVVHGGHVIVWVERDEEPYVVALDRATGRDAWKADGLGATSWSSPALIPVAGGVQLVLSGKGVVVGLDPTDGRRLWTFTDVAGNTTPTPIPAGEGRFVLGASAGRDAGPTDARLVPVTNGLYEIVREGDAWSCRRVWGSKRSACSFNSPLVHAGRVTFVNQQGIVFGHDLATGEELFAERTEGGGNWATPLGVGDRVLLFGKSGTTTVLKAGRTFEVLQTNPTWAESDTAPDADLTPETDPDRQRAAAMFSQPVLYAGILAGDTLLLRRGNVLYAFGPTAVR